MKQKDFLDDIKCISERVSILNYHKYKLLDKELSVAYQQSYMKWNQPLSSFGQNSGDDDQVKANLHIHLANSIYSYFYCPGTTDKATALDGTVLTAMPSQHEREKTIKLLSAANSTKDGLDYIWTVYAMDANGTAFVTKNKEVRSLVPGQWEFFNTAENSLKVGSVVNIKTTREDTTMQPVFYHVKGQQLISQQAEYVRIYFNTNFDGALVLVREITRVFNHYKLPFLFKCLNHPDLFNRTDSAVLYLSKSDFQFGSNLLRMILPKVQPFLKTEVPLFTWMIVPGVSFSEDPGNGQSFGMSRCNMLAEGIVTAFTKDIKEGLPLVTEILKVFKKNGISTNQIYLKPNSQFPYNFSKLNAQ